MRIYLPPQSRVVKRVLPHSLLGRSLLIMLVPLVLVLAVALQIFYGTHLDLISRRFAASVASEIATTIDLLQRYPEPGDRNWILRNAWEQFELVMHIEPGAVLPRNRHTVLIGPVDDELTSAMHEKVRRPFTMDWSSDPVSVLIRVQMPDSVLNIEAPRKRLYIGTIYLFVLWLLGTALLLFGIAALFMRNQVRAIRRLAAAAEAFGMGRDLGPIKPEGATEVRQAGAAFNRMQERIVRFLQQRTEMLAGVSHDLRTPLTRMRLSLAMMPAGGEASRDIVEMTADVEEMERMISGYLAFARGEGTEQAQPTDLCVLLAEVAARARRAGAEISLDAPGELVLSLRADAVRRAVTNLVDNARRHAAHIRLAAVPVGTQVQVLVDDDGPGIPPDRREAAFRPFATNQSGGTGLGLAIARDIVRAHGGDITLSDSPLGGLRARILLPP
jgi:two-component system osmolarity sensor histidine kinase EnvZ